MDELNRRGFLRPAGSAAALPVLAQLLAACGGAPEKEGPETAATLGANAAKVKLGFVALTDHASIVMAKELGYFAERGLDVTLEKAKAELEKSQPTVAMTFPGDTHDLWIRYWLKSMGLDGRTSKSSRSLLRRWWPTWRSVPVRPTASGSRGGR